MIKKLLLFSFFMFSTLIAENEKNIFILHSYSQEYPWTKSQHVGFVDKLNDLNLLSEIKTEYLDTKRVPFQKEYQEHFLLYLKEKYSNYHPDIIYCSDDNALEFLHTYKSQLFPNTPVIFSGVNNLNMHKELNLELFTGVFETKEIKPNIELIRQFSPQTRDLFFVGDGSNTYKSIEKLIKNEMINFPKYNFHFFSSNALEVVVESVKNQKHPKPFIVLTTIGGFMDNIGNNVALRTCIQALSAIDNSVLITMEDAYMQPGVIGGYVTSGIKQGALAADMAHLFLSSKPIKNIKPITHGANIYMFDKNELQQSRLVLSEYIARNAVIKNKKIPFFEKNQHIIFNALFLLSLIMVVLLVFVFFFFKERSAEHKRLQLALQDKTDILSNTTLSLGMIEQVLALGYWHKDVLTDEIFFSKSLLRLCDKEENAVIETLDDFFRAVDGVDKNLVKDNIHHAIKSMHPVKFYHKILTDDNILITVLHTIDFYHDTTFHVQKIIGVIRQVDAAKL